MRLKQFYRAERSRDRGVVVPGRNISVHVNRHKPAILFFVRVNQVLVRLWARAMEAALCAVFVPLLRLMSDRESMSVVSTPRFGFRDIGHAPLNRTASVQRRVC